MPDPAFKMKARVWLYTGAAAWHFVTLPRRSSDRIRKMFGPMRRGWGSLPVLVTIGKTRWRTSIFPDRKSGAYVLPLKADVRQREKIVAGKTITFTVQIQA
jgi:hypothetical protein